MSVCQQVTEGNSLGVTLDLHLYVALNILEHMFKPINNIYNTYTLTISCAPKVFPCIHISAKLGFRLVFLLYRKGTILRQKSSKISMETCFTDTELFLIYTMTKEASFVTALLVIVCSTKINSVAMASSTREKQQYQLIGWILLKVKSKYGQGISNYFEISCNIYCSNPSRNKSLVLLLSRLQW